MLTRALAAFFVLVSVGGAIATTSYVPDYELLHLAGLGAIGLLLAVTTLSLRGPVVQDIAVLITLGVIFSSYSVKLLLIVVAPLSPVTLGMLPRIGIDDPDMPTLWMGALILTVWGVASFCVVAIVLSRIIKFPARAHHPFSTASPDLRLWWTVWAATLLLSLVTAGLSYQFDIGLMGSSVKVELPFRLRGIIFYTRSFVLTGLILMLAYLAQQRKSRAGFWWAIGLLVANGLADALVRSSKAAVLAPFLYTFFLMVSSGMPIRRRFALLIGMISVPLLLSLPYLNKLRVFRSAGHDVWEALYLTITTAPFAPFESMVQSVVWIIYRLPGIEILIGILGHTPEPTHASWSDILRVPNGVAGYLTNDLFLTPLHHPHLAAPSYFGWWYLMFGTVGVLLGGAILALFVRLGWSVILSINIRSAPVVRVFFLTVLFTAISEGTLDMLAKSVIAMAFTALLVEVGMRIPSVSAKQFARANQ